MRSLLVAALAWAATAAAQPAPPAPDSAAPAAVKPAPEKPAPAVAQPAAEKAAPAEVQPAAAKAPAKQAPIEAQPATAEKAAPVDVQPAAAKRPAKRSAAAEKAPAYKTKDDEELQKDMDAMRRQIANAPKEDVPPELAADKMVEQEARHFFERLLQGDARGMNALAGFPFVLEDKRLDDSDAFLREWLGALRSKRLELLTLYGVQVYSPDQMEKKFGRPPARLARLPWRGPRTWIAVANLSGHAAIAIYKQMPNGDYVVVGYTD